MTFTQYWLCRLGCWAFRKGGFPFALCMFNPFNTDLVDVFAFAKSEDAFIRHADGPFEKSGTN